MTRQLFRWIDRACVLGKAFPDEVAGELDWKLAPGYRGYAQVDPPPEGVAEIIMGLEDEGGPVRFIQVSLEASVQVDLDDLQADLEEGREAVPMHPGDPDRLVFDVPARDRAGDGNGASGAPRPGCRLTVDLRPADPTRPGRRVAGLTILPG